MNRLASLFQLMHRLWGSPGASSRLWVICGLQMGCLVGEMFWEPIPEIFIGLTASSRPLWAEEAAPQQPIRLAESGSAKTEPAETSGGLQKQLQRELGEAGVSEEENPFLSILQQMREVEMLLAQGQAGARTQQIQKQILAELDRLIDQTQNSALAQAKPAIKGKPDGASPSSAQGGSTPSEPKEMLPGAAKQPTAKPPSGPSTEEKSAEGQQIRTLLQEVWGLLPPSQRQQMLETPVEEFLPKYKPLIIDYFRRLAELQAQEK